MIDFLKQISKFKPNIKLIGSPKKDLTKKAFEFAKKAHEGQKRMSGEDYISHPIAVAKILTEMKSDPQTIAAAFLHDVVDDTSVTLEDIKKEFGKEIAYLVDGVSKLGKVRYPKQSIEIKPIEQREKEPIGFKSENLRKIFFAMAEDIRVILIKLADRLHNMQTLQSLPEEKQLRISLETMEIYVPLANRLGMEEMKMKLEDLAFIYLYPKEYRWVVENIKERREKNQKYLKKTQSLLKKRLKKERVSPIAIEFRVKSYWGIYQKLLKYEMNLEKLYDLVALRIIVKTVEDCYKTLGTIHKYWRPLPGRIKDYIAFPKPNGYKSLHTVVFYVNGKITEFQIRTNEMDKEAEYGICAHWAMKENVDLKTKGKKFSWITQLREWQKGISDSREFIEGLKLDFFKNRIFVFTPNGDIIDLPEKSSVIDFAYAIHTEVGNYCDGAKIDRKIVPLSKSLKNGDMVEIIINKKRVPNRDWLKFAKTNLARSHIKKWIKKESFLEHLKYGEKLLTKDFKETKGVSWHNYAKKKKKELLKFFSYKNLDNLTAAVGEKKISIKEIFGFLFPEDKKEVIPKKQQVKKIEKGVVSLGGEKGILTNLAKCCSPQPRDQIIGYITKDKGASIHKINCKNLKRIEAKWPQKIIKQVSWINKE